MDFGEKFEKVKADVASDAFRNSLQGVCGLVHNKVFEKSKKALIEVWNG